MLKYIDTAITFSEIPDEISLCINISGCPNKCPDCHSKYLWDDVGIDLTETTLDSLIEHNTGITCICFMGGDQQVSYIEKLAIKIQLEYPCLKVAWYSGQTEFPKYFEYFNYIKLGPYISELGDLRTPTTNQRMYNIVHGQKVDITYKFR